MIPLLLRRHHRLNGLLVEALKHPEAPHFCKQVAFDLTLFEKGFVYEHHFHGGKARAAVRRRWRDWPLHLGCFKVVFCLCAT